MLDSFIEYATSGIHAWLQLATMAVLLVGLWFQVTTIRLQRKTRKTQENMTRAMSWIDPAE